MHFFDEMGTLLSVLACFLYKLVNLCVFVVNVATIDQQLYNDCEVKKQNNLTIAFVNFSRGAIKLTIIFPDFNKGVT